MARQYTGLAGEITNCQIGVFAAYAARHGRGFIEHVNYLPNSWTNDPARLAAAQVPAAIPRGVTFATKPRLAMQMIRRAIALRVLFQWVAADSVHGVSSARRFASWGEMPRLGGTALVNGMACEPSDWQRLSAGAGTKGPRLHDWRYLELADLEGEHDQQPDETLWTRGLLIRRHVGDGELAFFSTWCPKGTPMATLVGVEGHRWCIEDSFETAKNELGLDHNETRSWHGWHRHTALVMLAFAMMAAIRRRANADEVAPKKRRALRLPKLLPSSAGRSRKSDG